MSTYWYLHCVPCDETTEDGINHGEQSLRDAVATYPVIRQFRQKYDWEMMLVSVEWNFPISAFGEFMENHWDHYPLEIVSEYGDREQLPWHSVESPAKI